MKDPYKTLGVPITASSDEIRVAFRKLAKKLHPDLNPGNAKAEAQFKDLSAANEILSDPEKRKRFDAGEIDAAGTERPRQPFYREHAGKEAGSRPYESTSGFSDFAGAEDLFAEMFGRKSGQARNQRGQDLNFTLTVDFLDAINGAKRRISLPDGGSLDLTIPAGTLDNSVLRLRGKGAAGSGKGEAGDALVTLTVSPHPLFVRDGFDIHIELPITIREAVLGGRVRVPTPSGPVMATIPKGSNNGSVIRLKGKGVAHGTARGDERVTLRVVLPAHPDAALENFLEGWDPSPDYNPRKDMPS